MSDTALSNAKKLALVRINDFYSKTVESLIGSPTQTEKDTWSLKLKIANDITYSRILSKESLSYLNALNVVTLEDLSRFANMIISKAILYSAVVGIADKLKAEAKETISTIVDADAIEEAFIKLEQKAMLAITELKTNPPNTNPMDIKIDVSTLLSPGPDGVSQILRDTNLLPILKEEVVVDAQVSIKPSVTLPVFQYTETQPVIETPPIQEMSIMEDLSMITPTSTESSRHVDLSKYGKGAPV
jgi:hypothetical protein